MANKTSSPKGNKQQSLQILLAVGLLLVAGGLIYWKYYSASPPSALFSSADEEPAPHWPRYSTPGIINLHDSSGRPNWTSYFQQQISNWQEDDLLKFNLIASDPSEHCYLYPESANVCIVDDSTDGMAYGMYLYWAETGHIVTAGYVLNDYYLNNPESPYSTHAWRNKMLCSTIGYMIGAPNRYQLPIKNTTCMEAAWNFDNIPNQQQPDRTDLDNIKTAYYGHDDVPGSSAVSYKVSEANEYFQKKQFGRRVGRSEDGLMEIYTRNLGDGFIMHTQVIQASTALKSRSIR